MDPSEPLESALPPAVVSKLVAGHREFLRFLERRVGDRAEAEEILQKAFVKSVEASATLRDEESAVAWFYRLLRNAVIDHYRRRESKRRGLAAFAEQLESAEVELEADMKGAVCGCIRTLSDTLKPEYADALQRIEVDGMSVQAYANAIGIQPNNAAVRVHRAREALRKRVLASCGTCAQHGCLDCSCGRGDRAS